MQLTEYHAKYYASELTKRCASGDLQNVSRVFANAQVDLNPHQVEAALFAFKSPLSKGAILADEVGLGKTIEAGILLSQKWAEGKKRILIISPSNLRKQWERELLEKFFLPSIILESTNFNKAIKQGIKNPFKIKEIVLCSYQFAANKENFISETQWDLVVIDEAHRLRNVYKRENKIARKLKIALSTAPKILLTATPLQNSLLELYGLTSFIDEYTFGDLKSFKQRYVRLNNIDVFNDLKSRLAPLCHRTLRSQVLEYISYTNRIAITQKFTPFSDETALYDLVSDYLQRNDIYALPAGQRSLMILVMRKLLASSSFAIAGALETLASKLKKRIEDDQRRKEISDEQNTLLNDFESGNEISEEWGNDAIQDDPLSEGDIKAIQSEITDLIAFRDLAVSIKQNSKGQSLIKGLEKGLEKAKELGAAPKAIIFTESRRTQEYLFQLLSNDKYAGKIVLFNGTNNDKESQEIYNKWKKQHEDSDLITGSKMADLRASLVDHFKNDAQIMIATEAAAEGINLQFCSMVVNYDLPWNPQRIEQRIGRCHRYGQKHDVVVVNFLNSSNAADQRVFQLLSEKFKLFNGVFGASDEVLGTIESGIDFEKRIVSIYQNCRTNKAIQTEFDFLRNEMDEQISEAMSQTRQRLLENFDAEVHEKLKINEEQSSQYLNQYESFLWQLTQYELGKCAEFEKEQLRFKLGSQPYSDIEIPTGYYRMGKDVINDHCYRLGHPLAQKILSKVTAATPPRCQLIFLYSTTQINIASIEPLIGKSGILSLQKLTIHNTETQDHLCWAAQTDSGTQLTTEQCQRLFCLEADVKKLETQIDESLVEEIAKSEKNKVLDTIANANATAFESEMEKLDNWAEDKKRSLELQIKDFDIELKALKSMSRQIAKLEDKIKHQRKIKSIEKKRIELRRKLFDEQDKIDDQRDHLIDGVEKHLKYSSVEKTLFTIKWSLQ